MSRSLFRRLCRQTVAVLASVILLLGVAAVLVPFMMRADVSPRIWLLLVSSGAVIAAVIAPWFLYRRSKELMDVSHVAAMAGEHLGTTAEFTLAVCSLVLTTVGPVLLLGGMVLPTVFAWCGNEQGDRDGKRLGYLLAANGAGGIVGAEIASFAILPVLWPVPRICCCWRSLCRQFRRRLNAVPHVSRNRGKAFSAERFSSHSL